jgi:hypothetical protein
MRRADHSSRGDLPSVVFRNVEEWRDPGPLGAVVAWRKDNNIVVYSTYIKTLCLFLLILEDESLSRPPRSVRFLYVVNQSGWKLNKIPLQNIRFPLSVSFNQCSSLTITFILLMWRIGRAPNSNPIYSYIQQDATSHSLFISGNCSTCFGWYFHPSSGVHTTLSTASGICHTVTAICRYRGRVGTGLNVLLVAYATHSTFKPVWVCCGWLTPPTAHSNLFQLFHDSGR